MACKGICSRYQALKPYIKKKGGNANNGGGRYSIGQKRCQICDLFIKFEGVWLWVAIEPESKDVLRLNISKERNMFVAERFLSNVIKEYGEHPVSTDGGTWYPQACQFLKLNHHIHSPYEKYHRKDDTVHKG
jgi:hypothetical protein